MVNQALQPVPPPKHLASSKQSSRQSAGVDLTAVLQRVDRETELAHFQRVGVLREQLMPSWGLEIRIPMPTNDGSLPCNDYPSALNLAVESGLPSEVERVLEENSDPNVRGCSRENSIGFEHDFGWTPLQRAAYLGYYQIMNLLLHAGADVNADAAHCGGRTALQAAAGSGNMDIVERLLEVGAEVNAGPAEDYGLTALQAAANSGNLAIVERLLEVGAEVNAGPSKDGGLTEIGRASFRERVSR